MSSDARLIAERYVEALFDLAAESNEHDRIKADFEWLASVLAGSEELRTFLTSPIVSREESEKAIVQLLTIGKATELTRKFFALLARNRRLALTPLVIDAYLERLAKSRGELTVQVTSAAPLGEDEVKTITGAIAKSTGKKVTLETREDPALLGGLQVRVGSQMLDNSVAGKLERLKQALSSAA
jgi:F-type H+-transporting ATPase subunit delta